MPDNYLINGPVTSEVISHFLEEAALKTDTGGHSFFLGQVRADEINGKKVTAIVYSAYESMVKAEADKIVESVLAGYDDVKSVRIIHSASEVRVGQISLAVMVSAGHRQHAMQACTKIVELIKERLPVWKKEIFEDSSHAWRENR